MYAIILGFLATLMVYLGSGPLWLSVRYTVTGCRNGWWYNLLYINNLVSLQTDELVNFKCHFQLFYFNFELST